jgi:hypothetical protein
MLLQNPDHTSFLPQRSAGLPWIGVASDAPYFIDEHGAPWTPVGQNDAITWPELAGLFRRKDLPASSSTFGGWPSTGSPACA